MKKIRKNKSILGNGWKKAVVILAIFCFAEVYLQSLEAVTNKEVQEVQSNISKYESEIDSLEIQKTELVSFNHLAEVAKNNGYKYQNDYFSSLSKDEQNIQKNNDEN